MNRSPYTTVIAILAACVVMFAGCASQPQWPAISEVVTDTRIAGRWVWVEMICDDVEQAKAFYGPVFSWQFDTVGTGSDTYTVIRSGDRRIGGIVHQRRQADDMRSARWLASMSVPSVEATERQVLSTGGEVVIGPRSLPGRGDVAVFTDPENALFAVIRSLSGDPPQVTPPNNSWIWLELWAQDPRKMSDFYRGIAGYEVREMAGEGAQREFHLLVDGSPRAGIVTMPRQDLPSTWLPYVRVADMGATLERVMDSGGYVAVAPNASFREGKTAVIIDPLGGALGLVSSPDEAKGGDS